MTFWDWLSTPTGAEVTHALIGLIVAISAYIGYRTHRQTLRNADRLELHLEEHVMNGDTGKASPK